MNFIYQSKLFKQMIAVIGLLIILAIGIPGAFTLFYITPNVVEERYHKVMINDVDFLANSLDWLLAKSLVDVEYLSSKINLSDPSKLYSRRKNNLINPGNRKNASRTDCTFLVRSSKVT